MEFKDYYKILKVEPDADIKAIKKAYRRLAKKYHPDVSSEHDAENQFKEVSEAYEVLGDESKRREYDQLRKYGSSGEEFSPPPGWNTNDMHFEANGSDFSEFFENLFGQRTESGFRRRGEGRSSEDFYSTRGQDIEMDLPVFLEDTLGGKSQTLDFHLPHYGASGKSEDVRKTLKVKIPEGVTEGERIRLQGQGRPGYGTGPAGDLFLRVKLVPHPTFDVAGKDLFLVLPVAPWEAVLGTSVTVPTLTNKIKLTIPANSHAGQKLRVKGKGLPGKTNPGDLIVVLKIVTPSVSNPEELSKWQALGEMSSFNPREELES